MTLETLINALAYELGLFIAERNPTIRHTLWFKRLMAHCLPDWTAWKTKQTLKDVDKQIQDLNKEWDRQEKEASKPLYSEKPADGSTAQALLGGEMRLTAPWVEDADTDITEH